MTSQDIGVDFIAYDKRGRVLLLAEAKSRPGTSDVWASGLRRNMLAHRDLPPTRYFLIATPEHMYLWSERDSEQPFTIDAAMVLMPYFRKFGQKPADIGPEAFRYLVLTWLTDLTLSPERSEDGHEPAPGLSELTGLLREARVEMNSPQ